jgi:UDP-N-acetylmuramate dehydrogenase
MNNISTIKQVITDIRNKYPSIRLLEHEPMHLHCSFRTGGPVRVLALPQDEESLVALCTYLSSVGVTPCLLGNGTNVVFPDEGDDSLFVISTGDLQSVRLLPEGVISASAGLPLSRLAAFACEHGLAGLEFASGIPGSVGEGILMNAGAYGGELKDVVVSVRFLDLSTGKVCEYSGSECAFGYRHSCFQTGGKVILQASFRLQPGDKAEISARMKDLNQRRRDKQPLDLPSCGSAFRRPEGYFAAALIDECGLKGVSVGGAQVSEKHAGFIVNTGHATTSDLRNLLALVRSEVYRQKHIDLQPEIIISDH